VPVSGDGAHTITYAAADASGNTEATRTLTVNIDGVSPVAAVLANAKAKKGAKATIKYQVVDTLTGSAVTTIKIKSRAGRVVKTLKSTKPVGAAQNVKSSCKLAKGVYKVTAQAKDSAGNVSAVSPAKKPTVK
jgi:redox-regulated HSP33 family molecular chaperone